MNEKNTQLHCKDFKPLIEKAINELKDGENRFCISDFPIRDICLENFPVPDMSENISSDYCISSDNKDIEADYFEEIKLLEKLMIDAEIPVNLADWQKGFKIESTEKMLKGFNRRAYAIQLWNWYAIPLRYKNDAICVVWSPSDILGTPIIHSYCVNYFLAILINQAENQAEGRIKTLKQLSFWKSFGIIAIIILIGLLSGLVNSII